MGSFQICIFSGYLEAASLTFPCAGLFWKGLKQSCSVKIECMEVSPLPTKNKVFNAAGQGPLTKALVGSCSFYSHVYVATLSLEPFSDGDLQRGEEQQAVIAVSPRQLTVELELGRGFAKIKSSQLNIKLIKKFNQ